MLLMAPYINVFEAFCPLIFADIHYPERHADLGRGNPGCIIKAIAGMNREAQTAR
jgi:hypothetical protein